MKIIEWLDEIGIEASLSQGWRDIKAALKLGRFEMVKNY